jgi:ribosome-associated protein
MSETAAKKDVQKLQRAIVDGLEDVKAQDIRVFNTEHLSPLFERVIVASGTSNRQTKALAASVREQVREAGFAKPRIEGEDNGEWIIVDCGAAVAHIMQPAIRQYYNLEEIWGEKPVRLKGPGATAKASRQAAADAPAARSAPRKAPASKAAAGTARSASAAGTPAKAAKTAKALKATPARADQAAPARAASARPPARKSAARAAAPTQQLVVGKPAAKSAAKPAAKSVAKPAAPKSATAKAAPRSPRAGERPAAKAPARKAAPRKPA